MECPTSKPSPSLCPDSPKRQRRSGRSAAPLGSELAELGRLEVVERLLAELEAGLEQLELELVAKQSFACFCFLQSPIE
jgi:hypothetical protein